MGNPKHKVNEKRSISAILSTLRNVDDFDPSGRESLLVGPCELINITKCLNSERPHDSFGSNSLHYEVSNSKNIHSRRWEAILKIPPYWNWYILGFMIMASK